MLALVALAALDALRRDDLQPTGPPDPALEAAERALRDARVRGTLVTTEGGGVPGCTTRARRLPELDPTAPPDGPDLGCVVSVSPDGRRVRPGTAAWTARSDAYAICRGATVFVFPAGSDRSTAAYAGCAPAFRPDGSLTVARDGEVLAVAPGCAGAPPCEELQISRDALRRASARHPALPTEVGAETTVDVADLVWADGGTAIVLLRLRIASRPELGARVVAAFANGRLIWARPALGRAERVELSPSGRYVAIQPWSVLRRDGSQVELPLPLARRAAGFAWSPDERWLAVATGTGVAVIERADLEPGRGRAPPTIELPLVAWDVAWR